MFPKKDFFARLKTSYHSLSRSEEKVGEYIINNAHEVISMTLAGTGGPLQS